MTKPPPITIAPAGIDGHKPMGLPVGEAEIIHLAKLPPFQAYIRSRFTPADGIPSDQFAYERARAALADEGIEFVRAYEQWHADAGKWPNETPYGELKP